MVTRGDALVVTAREAAQLANVSPRTVVGWIESGKLPVIWIDGIRFVRPSDLLATQQTMHVGEIVPLWRGDPRRCGWRLRRLREAARLTQIELAERSALTHETISMLELGHESPRGATVIQLARALDIAPTAFVCDAEPTIAVDLSVGEAARLLDVPAARLRSWAVTGKVAGRKVAGRWRLSRREIVGLLDSGRLRGRSRRLDPRWRG